MKQRYRDLDSTIYYEAASTAVDKKWLRDDFLTCMRKYSGVRKEEIEYELLTGKFKARVEAVDGLAMEMQQRLEDLMEGIADNLDLIPIHTRKIIDNGNEKERVINILEPMHQCYEHLAYLGLKPLLKARILPHQFASIPKKGQTACARRIRRFLRKKAVKVARKTDVKQAYPSTDVWCVYAIIKAEIPSAKWLLILLEQLFKMAPNGTLLIGGYLDAWLFNFIMSYLIRDTMSQRKYRRGKAFKLSEYFASYMDDTVFFSRADKNANKTVTHYRKKARKLLGLTVKPETDSVTFLTAKEERRRKKEAKPSKRACPGLDMAGFVLHRTYTTIRWRIYRKARRQFLRAARDLEGTGKIPLFRARKLCAYYGYYKHSNSKYAVQKYDINRLMSCAKATLRIYSRKQKEKEKRRIEELECILYGKTERNRG